jgi:hypothetical protein
MTPYEIDVLLWYYTRPGDHPDVQRDPPVWRPTIQNFIVDGLLSQMVSETSVYVLTDRGAAYCQALQQVPLPEQQWVMCWPKQP